jgi:hypothetical protein
MKSLTITLEKRYINFAADVLLEGSGHEYLPEILDIATEMRKEPYVPTEEMNAVLRPEIIVQLYKRNSIKPEGLAAAYNAAIKVALVPQLGAYAGSSDPEEVESASYIINEIGIHDANQVAARDAKIEETRKTFMGEA